MTTYPLIAPQPPRLSDHVDALRRIERSGVFSNNGPEVRSFEREINDQLFGGHGATLAVANATLGLMIAIRHAAGRRHAPGAFALMPALTFAATAQAAIWAGLTPLICDIDPDDWATSADAEDRLIAEHGERIAVIVPYATFGNAIDLGRYAAIERRHGIGIVIDAAASLGTIDHRGIGFAADQPFATVFSMHATKTFAVAEGGVIHSGDARLIDTLRAMTNFGFEIGRNATLPGINAKLPEVIALMARLKLAEIEAVCDARSAIEAAYRDTLGGAFAFQRPYGLRRASQFMPVMLPDFLAGRRAEILAALEAAGVGAGQYFSPHLGEQPFFKASAVIAPTPVADDVAGRMISLPITDAMEPADAVEIAGRFAAVCATARPATPVKATTGRLPAIASVVVIGGGPAGTALLTAATKRGLLPRLAASGLVVVERDAAIGGGRLGNYAITSDSTATTFLSAVKDNVHPPIAALANAPVGRAIRRHSDEVGVPLVEVGPLLRETGDRLAGVVGDNGGTILTGHEVTGATLGHDGIWTVAIRNRADGSVIDQRSEAIVIATGGHQPVDRLMAQRVAGLPLAATLGERLLQSDDVLALGGMAKVGDLMAGRRSPRVTVIGGSTSALATVGLLLKGDPAIPFGAGGVTLLHRRPLRPFYHSVEAAHAEGFTDFGPDDICPVSGFVYRLAGFRLDARELVLRMLQVDGRAPDPRLALHRINGDDDHAAQQILQQSDLVIAALGYRPHALSLSNDAGQRIALAADTGAPMVDKHCRVIDANGQPIPGVFGIGLAAGFVPWGSLGGEPSFRGQANGLWLWQNDVGLMIVDQLLESALGEGRVRAVA